jgi:PAS domain S-box-containing protein
MGRLTHRGNAMDEVEAFGAQDAERAAELRRRAEEWVAQRIGADRKRVADADGAALLHELEVHQVELEMQNEELRRTQLEIEIAAERLNSLYDFAPVGYLTLDAEGRIQEANLTLARLVQTERPQLLGVSLGRLVQRDDQDEYHRFRRRLLTSDSDGQSVCEVRLGLDDAARFWARLEGGPWPVAAGIAGWRIAVSDVTDRKAAEESLRELNQELERRVDRRTQQMVEANRRLREEVVFRREAELQLLDREEQLEQGVRDRTRDLEALLEISRQVVSTLQFDEVLSVILDHLDRRVGFTGCGLYTLEDGMLRVLGSRGSLLPVKGQRASLSLESVAGVSEVIASCSPRSVDDVTADSPEAIAWRAGAQPAQLARLGSARSWMGAPLLARDRAIGVLEMVHEQPAYYDASRVGMATAIANQTAAVLENARLYRQVQQAAALEERQRMARELHDSVSQIFFGIVLAAETARMTPEGSSEAVDRLLGRILGLCKSGLTEMRAVIAALTPDRLKIDGLVGALKREIDGLQAREDIVLTAELPDEPEVPLPVKEAAYRIAQEALRNVFRHSSARHASLELTVEGPLLILEVTDDGAGFDPSQRYAGLGLHSMLQRAAGLGGVVRIESATGRGARVMAELPVEPGGAAGVTQAGLP